MDDGDNLPFGEPMEEMPPVEQPQDKEPTALGVPQPIVGEDPSENGGDDLEDPDDDLEGSGNPTNVPRGWTVTNYFCDFMECLFHWRLHDLLHR